MYSSSWYCSKWKSKFSNKWCQLYVPVVTLSTKETIKLLKQLESGFKRTIKWNKNLIKTTNQAQNTYLNFPVDLSFQRVNRLFLPFKDGDGRESCKLYYFPTVEIKDYVMIDGRNFFNQAIKSDLKTYCNRSRWWLYNCMFIRLSLFQKILQINCNRFKSTAKTRCWSKSNTTN